MRFAIGLRQKETRTMIAMAAPNVSTRFGPVDPKTRAGKIKSRNDSHGTRRRHGGHCLREDRQEGKFPAAQTLHRRAGSDEAITAGGHWEPTFPPTGRLALLMRDASHRPEGQNISIPRPATTVANMFLNVSNMLTALGKYALEFLTAMTVANVFRMFPTC